MTEKQDKNKERPCLGYEINLGRVFKTDWSDKLQYVANVVEEEIKPVQREKLSYAADIPDSRRAQEPLNYTANCSIPTTDMADLTSLQGMLDPEFIDLLPAKLEAGEIDDITLMNIVDSIFNKKYKNPGYTLKKPEKNILR